jgi:8-oxo-dGTP pyrophosphatase MutT (NUDIX family)
MTASPDSSGKIRPASTVILVREQNEELQVYLIKRSSRSGFFPGNYVFPGGTLEADDRQTEFWKDHLDLTTGEILQAFGPGLDLNGIISHGVAAVRETLEEAGVFLARKGKDSQGTFEGSCQRPPSGELEEGGFRRKVRDEGWTLSFSGLFPWSHWITPQGMPKRFDTRFFMALMPEGQLCIPDDQETVHGLWISPEQGLQGNMRGELPLSPPTVITLHELLQYGTLAALTQALRPGAWKEPRLPILYKLEKGGLIVEPWDLEYGKTIRIEPAGLEDKVAAVGEPFSRIWLKKGIWRPIKS